MELEDIDNLDSALFYQRKSLLCDLGEPNKRYYLRRQNVIRDNKGHIVSKKKVKEMIKNHPETWVCFDNRLFIEDDIDEVLIKNTVKSHNQEMKVRKFRTQRNFFMGVLFADMLVNLIVVGMWLL